jgi:hypothetical protein
MATYTFATDDVQELSLTFYRTEVINPQRVAAGDAPFATNQEYVDARVSDILQPVVSDYTQHDAHEVADAYGSADTTTKQAARTALGL